MDSGESSLLCCLRFRDCVSSFVCDSCAWSFGHRARFSWLLPLRAWTPIARLRSSCSVLCSSPVSALCWSWAKPFLLSTVKNQLTSGECNAPASKGLEFRIWSLGFGGRPCFSCPPSLFEKACCLISIVCCVAGLLSAPTAPLYTSLTAENLDLSNRCRDLLGSFWRLGGRAWFM